MVPGKNSFPNGAPVCFFAEVRIQAWMRPGEKVELVFGLLRGEPPRDAPRYCNDYAPDVCRYPDVFLMINQSLENASQSPGSPVEAPPPPHPPTPASLVSAVFYYLYFLLCGRDGWLAGDES